MLPVVGVVQRWIGYAASGTIPPRIALDLPVGELAAQGALALIANAPFAVFIIFFAWLIEAFTIGETSPERVSPAQIERVGGRLKVLGRLAGLLGRFGWIARLERPMLLVLVIVYTLVLPLLAIPFLLVTVGATLLTIVMIKRAGLLSFGAVAPSILIILFTWCAYDGLFPVRASRPEQLVFAPDAAMTSGRYVVLGQTDTSLFLVACPGGGLTLEVPRASALSVTYDAGQGSRIHGPTLWDVLSGQRPTTGFQMDCS
jgi:hypothetical protein